MAARLAVIGLLVAFATTGADAQVVLVPTHYQLECDLDFGTEVLRGASRIDLRNPSSESVREASFLLYRLLRVTAVRDGHGQALPFRQATVAFDDFPKLQVNHVTVDLSTPLAPGARATIAVQFDGHLLGYAETGMLYVKDRIDRAFTILRPDAYAYPQPGYPSLAINRSAPEWSFSYVARITVPDGLSVANGGRLESREPRGNTTTYQFSSLKPSWRMDFAIAPYSALTSGPVRVLHLPGDEVGAAGVARAAGQALDLYARWFGPRRESVPITIIEIPDGWGSQADVTTIIQSAAAFKDPERHREVYHELSHLWDVPSIERPSPRWNEGLASFLEHLVTQELSGTPIVDARANQLIAWLRTSVDEHPDWRTVPLADYGRARLTDLSYSVGALYFDLVYRLAGPEAFRRIVGGFSTRFGAQGASLRDLVEWERTNSPVDLSELNQDWIFGTAWIDRVRRWTSITDIEAYYRRQNRQ